MEDTDPVMLRARELFTASELTLDELGKRMGYEGEVARKGAWKFLNKTDDPRLSTVRRFAAAIGADMSALLIPTTAKKKTQKKAGG